MLFPIKENELIVSSKLLEDAISNGSSG